MKDLAVIVHISIVTIVATYIDMVVVHTKMTSLEVMTSDLGGHGLLLVAIWVSI